MHFKSQSFINFGIIQKNDTDGLPLFLLCCSKYGRMSNHSPQCDSLHLVHPQSVSQSVEIEETAPALVTVTVLLATAGHTAYSLPLAVRNLAH